MLMVIVSEVVYIGKGFTAWSSPNEASGILSRTFVWIFYDKKCVCTVHIINVARSRLIFYRSMQPTLCSDDSASCSKHALDSCSTTGSSSLCEVSFS